MLPSLVWFVGCYLQAGAVAPTRLFPALPADASPARGCVSNRLPDKRRGMERIMRRATVR
jgi:hypothetical protein